MWTICCLYRVAGRKDIGLQRQTNKERRIDEREGYSKTDWLRTTDATRKEEKIMGGSERRNKYKQICKWSCYVPSGTSSKLEKPSTYEIRLVIKYRNNLRGSFNNIRWEFFLWPLTLMGYRLSGIRSECTITLIWYYVKVTNKGNERRTSPNNALLCL